MTGQAAAGRRALGRWPLRRQLVVGITVLLAAALAAAGVATILTLNASVTRVVDSQLGSSMSAFQFSVAKYRDNPYAGGPAGAATPSDVKGFTKPLVDFVGHGYGSLLVIADEGRVLDSALFTEGDPVVLDPAAADALVAAAGATTGSATTVDVAGLGSYRVTAVEQDGQTLIAGVSMDVAHDAVVMVTVVVAVIGGLTLAAVMVGIVVIVRLALRPLGRVTETARTVADLRLDSGDERIKVRVEDRDTDVGTEVGQVGEAFNRMLDHVDHALAVRAETDRRMRMFVTDASHELRTPLAAIQGYAQLTRHESDSLPDMTEHALDRIESETQRMGALVADLLLLARLDEGQDLHREPLDLSELLVTAVGDAEAAAPDHDWVITVPEPSVVVLGDRERLQQVLVNLLSNAAIHTPAGSRVTATLSTIADGRGGWALASIADNGPGIDPELVPRLFDRFVRGDRSRSRAAGSTGLGLAIAASIVEAHAGSLAVESSEIGATFLMRLPLATEAELTGSGSTPAEVTTPTAQNPSHDPSLTSV